MGVIADWSEQVYPLHYPMERVAEENPDWHAICRHDGFAGMNRQNRQDGSRLIQMVLKLSHPSKDSGASAE